jgi:Xaa-Pro aminopeptidase
MRFDVPTLAARRARLYERMGDDAVMILRAGGPKLRSNDTDYRFRADSDMIYLTGFEEPDAVAVFRPGRKEEDGGPFTLFVRPRDPKKEQWDGRRAGATGAVADYGANRGFDLGDLAEQLPGLLEGANQLYVQLGVDPGFDARLHKILAGLRRRRGKPPANPALLRDPRDLLQAMRLVKADDELAWLRRASEISAEAHTAAMRACRPGMHEYELQALIEYVFARRGAAAPSYNTIVGAGANATILHYVENRDAIGDGDIVLIDAGCEFNFYAGDITRSFPANGKFTPAQRDLYQAVLDAEIMGIGMCTTDHSWLDVHEATVRMLTQSLVDMGLLKGGVDELIANKDYEKYYMHKTGHWIGIDVHDPNPYYAGATAAKIQNGAVQTIEPGLYIPADDESAPAEMRGIGIRIEDDVLATPGGPEVLTASCPKALSEIEALVGSGYTISLP